MRPGPPQGCIPGLHTRNLPTSDRGMGVRGRRFLLYLSLKGVNCVRRLQWKR